METSFLKLVSGSRISNYMGLKMLAERAFKYAPDYTYVEIPLLGFLGKDDTVPQDKALRNQYVRLIPACVVDVKGRDKLLVEPNPALAEFGMVQPGYYMHPGQGGSPGLYMSVRKDIEVADVDFAIRLYMRP